MKRVFEVTASSTTVSALFCTYVYIPNFQGNIDIEICGKCGGPVKVIACIEGPVVIDKPFAHLEYKEVFQPIQYVCQRHVYHRKAGCSINTGTVFFKA